MSGIEIAVAAAGAALIIFVLWFFFGEKTGMRAGVTSEGIQEVDIRVEGSYQPNKVLVRAGMPVRLKFNRQETNPCSLCARMKRGALHNAALELGIKKLALGHHLDDVIETFLLSLFYEGRFNTFSPVTHLNRKDITVIRPLVYAEEADIIGAARQQNVPVVKSMCPADGVTCRAQMKTLVKDLVKIQPHLKERMLTALKTQDNRNLWDRLPSFPVSGQDPNGAHIHISNGRQEYERDE
jgi:hypothetical protein